MRLIGVGLIGYGAAGSTFHVPVMRAVPALRIAAVATSRTADATRDLPGVRIVATAAEVLTDPNVELVVIATPNETHAALGRQAIAAGKHVVIDKPMTTTAADADALIALARDRGVLLSVYHNRRWDGDFRTVADLVRGGRLGEVYRYEAHFDRFRPAIKAGWRERPGPGAGVLFDLGSHLVDGALALFGLPETVVADVLAQRPAARVDDYFAITLQYARRRAIVHASALVSQPGPRFAVHGDGGSFIKHGTDPQEAALKAGVPAGGPDWGREASEHDGTLVTADGTRIRVPTLPGDYPAFYAAMAAAIVDGTPVPVDPREARDTVAILESARRSALERRTVATGA